VTVTSQLVRKDAALMKYRILGPLEVRSGRRVVEVGPPKQRAVLVMLLLHADRIVPVDRLMEQLWGDRPPAQAISSVRAYVANLRRVLEPARVARSRPEVLVTRAPGYLLSTAADELDARTFEELAARGHRMLYQGQPAAASGILLQAQELWSGPPLPEFATASFAHANVARWVELHRNVREDQLRADLALGGHAVVVSQLESMVAEDPLRESLWAMLMTAQYRCGRQADALHSFERARRALAEELGVDPGPELRRLEADVLAHADTLELSPGTDRPQQAYAMPAGAPPDAGTTPTAKIIGRTEELTLLDRALHRAVDGHGGVVFLEGEPGIGKTRLADEFASRTRAAGYPVLCGQCHESSGAPPLWPWTLILDAVADIRSGPDSASDGDRWAHLAGRPDRAPILDTPPADPGPERFTLFEAAFSVLRRVAPADGALVVVLEDMHWADIASVQLLRHLATRLTSARVLLVVTYREADLTGSHPLHDTLAALATQGGVSRRTLAGLTPPQVGELVVESTGEAVPDPVRQMIWQRTEGNAFYVTELVSLLISEKRLTTGQTSAGMPPGVLGVVRRRLARLPDQTNAILAIAAVAGRDFDVALVQAISGLTAEEVMDGLEAAVVTSLVREDGDDANAFHFAHALTHEAVYQGIGLSHRARLHARTAQRLVAGARTDAATVTLSAHHAWHGRNVLPVDDTVSLLLQAADVSQRRSGWEDSELVLRRALAVLATAPAGRNRDGWELRTQFRMGQLMRATRGLADPQTARAFRRAHQLALGSEPSADVLQAVVGAWGVSLTRSDMSTAMTSAEAILAVGEQHREASYRVAGSLAVGVSACYAGDPRRAIGHLDTALLLAADTAMPSMAEPPLRFSVVPVASGIRAMALWLVDQPIHAWASVRSATAEARRESPYIRIVTLQMEARLALLEGRVGAVKAALIRQRRLCEQFGVASEHVAHGALVAAWVAMREGAGTARLGHVEQAWATLRQSPNRLEHPMKMLVLADARRLAGQPNQAVQALRDALVEMERTGLRWAEAEVRRVLADTLHDLGATWADRADAELSRAEAVAVAQGATAFARRARETGRRWGRPLAGGSSGAATTLENTPSRSQPARSG
jgi:DNA-binding SARP family transcriptional activator